MLRAWERATRDRTGGAIGGIDLSVFGTCTGSASGRVSEISSGLEAGFKSEAWGRRIPPDELGAFQATFGGSLSRVARFCSSHAVASDTNHQTPREGQPRHSLQSIHEARKPNRTRETGLAGGGALQRQKLD